MNGDSGWDSVEAERGRESKPRGLKDLPSPSWVPIPNVRLGLTEVTRKRKK